MFPGIFAPDGEEVDIDKMISNWSAKNPIGSAKDYTEEEIKDLFHFLRGNDKPFIIR